MIATRRRCVMRVPPSGTARARAARVATIRPSIFAGERRRLATPSAGGASSAPSSSAAPGSDERAHLDVRHAHAAAASRRRASAALRARASSARRICASSSSVAGKHRPARKVIAEERRRCRHVQRRAQRLAGSCCSTIVTRRRDAVESVPARAPAPRSSSKRSRSASGESKSATGSIGPRQSIELDHALAVDAGRAAVGDRVVVAVVDVDVELEHRARAATSPWKRVSVASAATGRPRKSMCAIATHAASWPTASATRHAGNAAIVRRHRERAARALRRLELGDAVDERERGEMIGDMHDERHGALNAARRRFPLRADHELAERLRREQPRNVGDLHRRLEALGRRPRTGSLAAAPGPSR